MKSALLFVFVFSALLLAVLLAVAFVEANDAFAHAHGVPCTLGKYGKLLLLDKRVWR